MNIDTILTVATLTSSGVLGFILGYKGFDMKGMVGMGAMAVLIISVGENTRREAIKDGRHEMALEAVASGHGTLVSNGTVEVFSWSDVHERDIMFDNDTDLTNAFYKLFSITNRPAPSDNTVPSNHYKLKPDPQMRYFNEELSNAIERLYPSSNKCNLIYCDRHVGNAVLTSTIELQ